MHHRPHFSQIAVSSIVQNNHFRGCQAVSYRFSYLDAMCNIEQNVKPKPKTQNPERLQSDFLSVMVLLNSLNNAELHSFRV